MRDLRGAALRLDDEQQGPRRARGNRSDTFLRGAVLHPGEPVRCRPGRHRP